MCRAIPSGARGNRFHTPTDEFTLTLKGSGTRYRVSNATWNNELVSESFTADATYDLPYLSLSSDSGYHRFVTTSSATAFDDPHTLTPAIRGPARCQRISVASRTSCLCQSRQTFVELGVGKVKIQAAHRDGETRRAFAPDRQLNRPRSQVLQ